MLFRSAAVTAGAESRAGDSVALRAESISMARGQSFASARAWMLRAEVSPEVGEVDESLSGVRKKGAVTPIYKPHRLKSPVGNWLKFRHAYRSYCAEGICTISVSSISAHGKWAAWPDGSRLHGLTVHPRSQRAT